MKRKRGEAMQSQIAGQVRVTRAEKKPPLSLTLRDPRKPGCAQQRQRGANISDEPVPQHLLPEFDEDTLLPPRQIPNRSKNTPFYHLAECVKPARVPVVVQKGGERSEAMPAPRKAKIERLAVANVVML